jgi:hypothetical protein
MKVNGHNHLDERGLLLLNCCHFIHARNIHLIEKQMTNSLPFYQDPHCLQGQSITLLLLAMTKIISKVRSVIQIIVRHDHFLLLSASFSIVKTALTDNTNILNVHNTYAIIVIDMLPCTESQNVHVIEASDIGDNVTNYYYYYMYSLVFH